MSAPAYRSLQVGDHAPWFRQRSTSNPSYAFDTVGGRYIVLCFFGSAGHADGQRRLAFAAEERALFDDVRAAFFGVSVDPLDESTGRVRESLPGVRHFWDADRTVSRLFGALPVEVADGGAEAFRPRWVLLNPNLQVRAVFPFGLEGAELSLLRQHLHSLPPLDRFGGMEMHAPVILLPDIFEPALCRTLIAAYEESGGMASGFMRDRDGKTVAVHDPGHKVRRDHLVEDEALRLQIQRRVRSKVAPVIQRIHEFEATRMERYLVGCYDASDGGHFRPHRDNTTRGTAHRRFALSINLNNDFDGGGIVFPEYGPRRYKPPAGAGVVFSCSLLHAVEPVRRGRRYAFLPFLYDERAAAVREANSPFLEQEGEPYRMVRPGPG